MKILITGSNGLLGQKIVDYCINNNFNFLASSKGENRYSKVIDYYYRSLDITRLEEVKQVVSNYNPTCIINTAAITNVDFCESNQLLCDQVNVEAVENLLQVSKENDIHLIHLSTDFVFDGENGPYKETDDRNALSYYGNSKVRSEDLLMNSNYANWSIVRTIIVFGIGENMSRSNIVLWAKGALEKGDPLKIVDDQFRAPTYAEDLALACVRIAELKAKGVYHVSGPETFSILDLVKKVALFFNLKTDNITPINSNTLNQAAKRPARTGFDISKARNDLGFEPLSFEDSLKEFSKQMQEN